MPLVFFITGVSSGFGLEIALHALSTSHHVIGTVRSRQRAAEPVQRIEAAGGRVLELDTTDAAACARVYADAEATHGRVDALVLNAGSSWLGAIEDFTDDEIHRQMDVNVYGPMRLVRAALPGFRRRRSGTIVNVTSLVGLSGLPSCGIYAASKFAMEGWSESLAQEVEPYNVKVLLVEPGAFRTNFLGAYTANSKKTLEEYPAAKKALDKFDSVAGKQPGDPAKAGRIIVEVITGEGTAGGLKGKTLRLPLGADCVESYEAKIQSLTKDLEATRKVATSTAVEE